MLRSLDRLGAVGTRSSARGGRHPRLARPPPALLAGSRAGDKLAPVSTTWSASRSPREASEIDKDANRRSGRHQPENIIPRAAGRQHPPVVRPGHVLSLVERCLLAAASEQGLQKVLAWSTWSKQLKKRCRRRSTTAARSAPSSGRSRRGRPRRAARRPRASLGSADGLLGRVRGRRHPTPAPSAAQLFGTPDEPAGSDPGGVHGVAPSAVGIVYMAGSYLGLVDRVLGRGITMRATLPRSGRALRERQVTYRGVKIGKVSAMTRDPRA